MYWDLLKRMKVAHGHAWMFAMVCLCISQALCAFKAHLYGRKQLSQTAWEPRQKKRLEDCQIHSGRAVFALSTTSTILEWQGYRPVPAPIWLSFRDFLLMIRPIREGALQKLIMIGQSAFKFRSWIVCKDWPPCARTWTRCSDIVFLYQWIPPSQPLWS